MAKQKEKNMAKVPRKRKLAAMVASVHGGEKNEASSCYARRCAATSTARGLKHYA